MSVNDSESWNESVTDISRSISEEKVDLEKSSEVELEYSESEEFPEGGAAGWCTVIGGVLVMFCGFGYTTSFGVYQDFYTLHYLTNESASTISWIGGINAFLGASVGIFAGILYDRGYFYQLMIGGSLLQSFTLFMLSLCQPGQFYQILLAQGVGAGIGQGITFVPTMAVLSQHFRKRRTLAMTLVASGSALGSIVHPIMLNYLINGRVGFGAAVRISATLITLLLFIACLIMRTGVEPPKRRVNYLAVARGILRDAPFCIMSVGVLLFHTGFFFPIFYFQLDSVVHGNSQTFSFYSLVLLNVGGLIGRLSAGVIANRIGVPRLIIIATGACSILIFGMIGLNKPWTIVVLGTLYGYFSGTYIAMMTPLMAVLTDDLSELGARVGIGMVFIGIGSLQSGPISGALLTSQYKWWQPALFNGLIATVGCLLLVAMQLLLTRTRRFPSENKNVTVRSGTPKVKDEDTS